MSLVKDSVRNLMRNWRIGIPYNANLVHMALLLAPFAILIVMAFWAIWGATGVLVALLIVAGGTALALRMTPESVMRLYGARAPEAGTQTQVDGLAAELAQRAQLVRAPKVYLIPSGMLSAFSAGTSERSCIALTEGVLRQLTMREIADVLAHEVAHIRNGDLAIMNVADVISRLAQLLYYLGLVLLALNLFRLLVDEELISWWAIAILVALPALMNLLQLSLPRQREFDADSIAGFLTGDPLGLASAITRLDTSTGHAIDDVLPPVPARRVPQPSMLRCHPADNVRVARLRKLEAPPVPPLDIAEEPRISLVGVGPIAMRPRYRWPGVWF
jgi:heat shock protein HtpX